MLFSSLILVPWSFHLAPWPHAGSLVLKLIRHWPWQILGWGNHGNYFLKSPWCLHLFYIYMAAYTWWECHGGIRPAIRQVDSGCPELLLQIHQKPLLRQNLLVCITKKNPCWYPSLGFSNMPSDWLAAYAASQSEAMFEKFLADMDFNVEFS